MLLANFNGKEHLRHRAVSLRQHGFLVVLVDEKNTDSYSVWMAASWSRLCALKSCWLSLFKLVAYYWKQIINTGSRKLNLVTKMLLDECIFKLAYYWIHVFYAIAYGFDSHLSLDKHINSICKSAFYHIRSLRHIRSAITGDMAQSVAFSLVSSRLDYSNALLFGTTQKNITWYMHDRRKRAGSICG